MGVSDRKGCIWGPDPYLARCIPFGLTTPLHEVILAEHETIVYRRVRGTRALVALGLEPRSVRSLPECPGRDAKVKTSTVSVQLYRSIAVPCTGPDRATLNVPALNGRLYGEVGTVR